MWFRQDLRLHDNPAINAAIDRSGWVLPVYIRCDAEDADWPLGAASRWWLHQSLRQLQQTLRANDSRLIVRRGPTQQVLLALVDETGADAVYWNRRYEPASISRDKDLKQSLRARGIACTSFNSALLIEPWDLSAASGRQYKVFAPFKKRLLELLKVTPPVPLPEKLRSPAKWPACAALADLGLMPRSQWYHQMASHWQPGENGAWVRANRFLQHSVSNYGETRDFPAIDGTASLSAHLHFGELSVRQLLRAMSRTERWRESAFVSELIWREFAYHLLYHFPSTPRVPLDSSFERFEWKRNPASIEAWRRGLTGIPIVDAGMRQLWALGWMHNRVRMIVASLLVKNLQQPWTVGAEWFWDTLVDADLAANTLNWQWVAGCGADAAPYFRVFNPVLQGRRFDPGGDYVRRWVPELAALPAEHVHAPHLATPTVLEAAGVRIGATYPAPIVDLKKSRQQALDAYRAMKTG